MKSNSELSIYIIHIYRIRGMHLSSLLPLPPQECVDTSTPTPLPPRHKCPVGRNNIFLIFSGKENMALLLSLVSRISQAIIVLAALSLSHKTLMG